MQEITVFALLLFVALYAFAVYIEFLKWKLQERNDTFRLMLEEKKHEYEKSQDANGKVGRDARGRFKKLG